MRVLARQANGSPINSIYVFGERNSGTNYVGGLIIKNCLSQGGHCLYDPKNKTEFGWKHGFPNMLGTPDDVLAIAVYRAPIAWLHALYRAPWHVAHHLRQTSFSTFIRSEWVSIIDDNGFGIEQGDHRWGHELLADRDPITGDRFANPIRLRTAKNRGFASLDKRFGNVLRVNYEEVVADPQAFLADLCETYGLKRQDAFDPITHDRGTPGRGLFQPKPVPELSAADMDFVRSELDLPAEAALGYVLDAAPAPSA